MKIHSIDCLSIISRELRADGSTVVLCHGCWDVPHVGHHKHLKAAKELGDALIVTVTPDQFVGKGPGRPMFTAKMRMEALANLECVDYVAENQWPSAVETIKAIQPHVYCKGGEFKGHATPGLLEEMDAIQRVGGRMVFTEGPEWHSTELIERLLRG